MDAGSVMGGLLNDDSSKFSAKNYAKLHKVRVAEKYEWLHLLADTLDGKTVPTNLICASYSANTFMLASEHKLTSSKTKTAFQVRVSAFGDNNVPHNAQTIKYEILHVNHTKDAPFCFEIDADCDYFNGADYEFYGNQVKTWMDKYKNN